tara:strand:- start:331 stop:552 length:222 start_codon:yes stop_codon:yes gene_type:complete
MSRNEFKSFIRAAERNYNLRKELKNCEGSNKEVILLAKKHGFSITLKDFEEDLMAEKTGEWFINSKINPIRRK